MNKPTKAAIDILTSLEGDTLADRLFTACANGSISKADGTRLDSPSDTSRDMLATLLQNRYKDAAADDFLSQLGQRMVARVDWHAVADALLRRDVLEYTP